MSVLRRVTALAVITLGLGLTSTAHAEDDALESSAPRLPVSQARRPLTLPRLVFDPALGVDVVRQAAVGTFVHLDHAAALGVTDDLTVGVLALPLQLAAPGGGGGFRYGQTIGNRGPSVDARYRFIHGSVELAVGLTLRIFTLPGLNGGAIIPAVPVRVHVTDDFRIDVAPAVNITRATTGSVAANAVRIELPASALYNINEALDVGVTSGFRIYDVSDTKNTTGIPLGAFLGYAIDAGTNGPVLDVGPFFTFPYLVMPGRSVVTNSAQYIVGVNVVGHLYL